MWKILIGAGWVLTIAKVKSHCTQADVDAGSISQEDMEGNNLADSWAGKGALLDEMDYDFVTSAMAFEHQAALIRERLIVAVQMGQGTQPEKVDREFKILERGLMPVLRALGHEPLKQGRDIECLACGQNWHTGQSHMMVSRGTCPGLSIWSVVDRQMARPIACNLLWD